MFRSFVFSQFYDLRKNGKDPLKARTHVILLVSVMIGLATFLIWMLAVKFNLLDMPTKSRGYSGRFIGKVIGLVFLGVVFGLSYLGLGKKMIERYWIEFQGLDETTQEAESKKGTRLFVISFFSLLAAVVIMAITSL